MNILLRYLGGGALENADRGQQPGEVAIEVCSDSTHAGWLALRQALWPDTSAVEHLAEMKACCDDPERYGQFLAVLENAGAIGFAEASLRRDYVNGTDSSPVGFLEGIYVLPQARRQGVARLLLGAVEAWALDKGCCELASDTPIDNRVSQCAHQALGFEETGRVVFFKKTLVQDPQD